MKASYLIVCLGAGLLTFAFFSSVPSQPSFNGPMPGCGPSGGCHTFQSGILAVQSVANLGVQITLTGGTGNVAGELVDSLGTVVAVNDRSSSNPFILTAPHIGRYTVNAGYKNPQRRWDSTQIVLGITGIGGEGSGTAGATFRLDQNYPNPFNPASTIEFVIPHPAFVTLKLYNLEGEEVMTVVAEPMHVGKHSVRLDAGNLPSGVYFYRMQAGNFTQTRKLILVR